MEPIINKNILHDMIRVVLYYDIAGFPALLRLGLIPWEEKELIRQLPSSLCTSFFR